MIIRDKTPQNRVDRKGHITAITIFIEKHAGNFSGVVLDVGCGDMPYKELVLSRGDKVEKYLGLDLADSQFPRNATPDLTWDGHSIPMPDGSADCALATELFEHCANPATVMREIHRVLKPNGMLLFTVPFLWPLHEVPYDHYRFTPFALEQLLGAAGFTSIKLTKLGGWDAALAQMLGLWVIRRPGLNRIFRKCLILLLTPIIGLLRKTDSADSDFSESQMLTGIGGTAQK